MIFLFIKENRFVNSNVVNILKKLANLYQECFEVHETRQGKIASLPLYTKDTLDKIRRIVDSCGLQTLFYFGKTADNLVIPYLTYTTCRTVYVTGSTLVVIILVMESLIFG